MRGERKRLGSEGFTMLELLAVFAILAIVAMVAVPRYTKAVETSKKNACKASVEMLNKAAAMYYEIEQVWPETVETLATEGYIDEEFKCPVSDTAVYGITDGVISCTCATVPE